MDHQFVQFRGVQKTYDGDKLIVKQLDLDIARGEFLSMLGPSGSGKTTCLMMLAGFEYPSAGEIRLDGRLLNRVPPHRRNIGMVFQNYALFPHMSVAQNVAYPLAVRGVGAHERERRVARALDMVQMDGFGPRLPAQLSGGQQQRVARARALVFDPQLVLMDEPLGALDKQLREHMQVELKALHRRLGITFVYVTHDQHEALTMSDRVAVFNHGRIQQIDTVDQLYEAPASAFVAGFVGDNNALLGVVASDGADTSVLRLSDGSELAGLNLDGLMPGQEAVACVRPERLQATRDNGAPGSVRGKVRDLLYFGDHVRVRCAIGSRSECTLKLPLGDPMLPQLAEGRVVGLRAQPQHVRIFKRVTA